MSWPAIHLLRTPIFNKLHFPMHPSCLSTRQHPNFVCCVRKRHDLSGSASKELAKIPIFQFVGSLVKVANDPEYLPQLPCCQPSGPRSRRRGYADAQDRRDEAATSLNPAQLQGGAAVVHDRN